MDRLPVFELIDKTVEILNDNRKMLETYADVMQGYFQDALSEHGESLVNISTRVKGESSLREKILRKNLYKRYAYPEGIIQNLSDLIGVRIQCRFLEEEQLLFETLRGKFTQVCADGLYCAPEQANRCALSCRSRRWCTCSGARWSTRSSTRTTAMC